MASQDPLDFRPSQGCYAAWQATQRLDDTTLGLAARTVRLPLSVVTEPDSPTGVEARSLMEASLRQRCCRGD